MPALETAPTRSAATLTFSNAAYAGPRVRAGHIPTRCSDQAALAARQAAVQASSAEGWRSGVGQLGPEGHASPAGQDELRSASGWQADSSIQVGQGLEPGKAAAATADQQVWLGSMQLATLGRGSGGDPEPAELPPVHGEPPTRAQLLEAVLLAAALPWHQQSRSEAKQDAGVAPSAASGLRSRSESDDEGTSRLEQELGLTDNEAGLGHSIPLKVSAADRQPDSTWQGRSARQQGVRDSIFEGSPHPTRPQSATEDLRDATGSAAGSLRPQGGARVPYTPRTLDGMWNADAATPRAAEQPRVQGQLTSLQHRPAAAELAGTVPQQKEPHRGFFTRSAGVTPELPQQGGGSGDAGSPMAQLDMPVEPEGITGAAPEAQSAGLARVACALPQANHTLAFHADRVRLPRIASEAAADMAEMVPPPEPGRRRRRSSGGSVPQVPQPSLLPMHHPASERVTAARTLAFLAGPSHLRDAAHGAAGPGPAVPANSCDAPQQRRAQQMNPPTLLSTAAQPHKDPGGRLQVRSGAPARLLNVQWQASRRRAIVAMLQTEEALQATHKQQEQDVQVGSTLNWTQQLTMQMTSSGGAKE